MGGAVSDHLEVKVLPSGKAIARRKDRLPLTDEDRTIARQLADNLRAQQKAPGITATDVLRIFPGARVVEWPTDDPKPLSCPECDKDTIPRWRRGGKIVQRMEPDGTPVWACQYCGRRSKITKQAQKRWSPRE